MVWPSGQCAPRGVGTWSVGSTARCLPYPDQSLTPDAPEKWVELRDFANVDPDDFKDALKEWLKADIDDVQEIEAESLSQRISAVDKGRARSAHHAARIRVGIVKNREGQSLGRAVEAHAAMPGDRRV